MATPQPTDAHLRIAHSINEAIMLRDFTKRQRKILDLILRCSWGCGKKTAIIPYLSSFGIVGVGKTHIKAELNWLTESRIIYTNGTTYNFNKDFDQWQVSRIMPFNPEGLTELIHLNLAEGYQNGNNSSQIGNPVTVLVTEGLPKRELLGYQNGNCPKANLATAKGGGEGRGLPLQSIKEILKKDIFTDKDIKFLDSFTLGNQSLYAIACILRGERSALPANKTRYINELASLGIPFNVGVNR